MIIGLFNKLFGSSQTAEQTANSPTHDNGVVINGIKWATRNIGAFGTFVARPEDAGLLYQWNRRQGWTAIGEKVSGWNNSLPIGTTWETLNAPCPTGWRIPTPQELQSLVDAGSIWTTQNGVNGRLFGTAPNQIFLPAIGMRGGDDSVLHFVNENGFCWSNAQGGSEFAYFLAFGNNGRFGENIRVDYGSRAFGLSIRCVAN